MSPALRAPGSVLVALLVLLALQTGCGGPEDHAGHGPMDDTTLDVTTLVLGDVRPFAASEGEPLVPCREGGVIDEAGGIEVRTAWCDPADLSAPLPADVWAGSTLALELSWGTLVADEGEAHVAVVVGEEIAFERIVALPASADFVAQRITLTQDHAAGEAVVFHVHNHGANIYTLRGLTFVPES